MTKDETRFEGAAQALAQLVTRCKRERLVRELATRLALTRQAVYLWAGEGCKLTNRAAKQRLLEISRLRGAALAVIAAFAKRAVESIEAEEEAGGREEK